MLMYSINAIVLIAVMLHGDYAESKKHKDCNERCGDVIITYPFGIEPDCSYNDFFAVSCDNNSSLPKPILKKLFNLELIEIRKFDSNFGVIIVNMPLPVHAKDCSSSSLNLTVSPFRFDSMNVLVSMGCNGNASLADQSGKVVGGCNSTATCDPTTAVCSGYYCCQSRIFRGDMEYYTVRVSSTHLNCSSAFLISSNFLQLYSTSASTIVNNSIVPVALNYFSYNINSGTWFEALLVFLSIIAVCCTLVLLYLVIQTNQETKKEARRRNKLLKERLEEISNGREVDEMLKLFKLNELLKATRDFSRKRILGQGSEGTIFKGMLTNGQAIAVKRYKKFEADQWTQLINEIILLSQVSHRNVVKLLGCCVDDKLPLIVYEYLPNGTLSQNIRKTTDGLILTWKMRLRIASEVAAAIAYLHYSSSTQIYHRDLKSVNIILDDNYQAKVIDFGISKAVPIDQTHFTTCVKGTLGYLDPEYFVTSQFSEKSDVYSFGVILVELLTGQEPIRPSSSSGEGVNLVEYFTSALDRLCLDDILDPVVVHDGEKDIIMSFAILAKQCLRRRGSERPTMKEVAFELEILVKKTGMLTVLPQSEFVTYA